MEGLGRDSISGNFSKGECIIWRRKSEPRDEPDGFSQCVQVSTVTVDYQQFCRQIPGYNGTREECIVRIVPVRSGCLWVETRTETAVSVDYWLYRPANFGQRECVCC